MIRNVLKKGRALLTAALFVVALGASTATSLVGQTNTVSAATSCDKVNIVYCGLPGSDASSYASSFKNSYNSNKSGHAASPTVKKDYTDLQTVFNWAGASSSIVNGMNNTNTKVGTVYKDGHIAVDGVTVGTDAWVSARFSGTGFVQVTGNVYARKTTTSFAQASAPVIVYMQNGQMVFAVMIDCGNAIKATPTPKPPVPPTPSPCLTCDQLAFSQSSTDAKSYTFTAKASAQNTAITGYTFNFGDSTTKTVATSSNTVSTSHAYATAGSYTVTVSVSSKDKTNITSAACAVKVTIAPPAIALSCDQLAFKPTSNDNEYTFTAKATPTNTTITGYTFDFGDKTVTPVTSSANTITATHKYATPGTYTAFVSVSSKEKSNITSAACAVKVTIAPPVECKPGIPAGSKECEETPVMTCDQLVITPKGDNQYSFVVKATAQNATITGYAVDFGDKTTPYAGSAASVDHTYAGPGVYPAVASVTFSANDTTKTLSSKECAVTTTIAPPMCTIPGKENLPVDSDQCVTKTCTAPNGQTYPEGSKECNVVTPPTTVTPTPPATLPNTGAGNVIGLFAGVSIAGAAAHRLFASRRLFGAMVR